MKNQTKKKNKSRKDEGNIAQFMPFLNKGLGTQQKDKNKQAMPDFASLIKSTPLKPAKPKDKEKSSNLPSFIGPPKLNFAQPQMPSAPLAGGAGGRVSDFASTAPKPPSQTNKSPAQKSKQKPQMPPMPSLQSPTPPKSQKPMSNGFLPASTFSASSTPESKGQKKRGDKGLAKAMNNALGGKNAEKAKAQFAPKIVDLPDNYAKNKATSDKGDDFIGPKMPGANFVEPQLPQPMVAPDFEKGAMTSKASRKREKMAPKIINRPIKEPDVKLTIRKPPKLDDAIEFARKMGNEQFIESMRMQ